MHLFAKSLVLLLTLLGMLSALPASAFVYGPDRSGGYGGAQGIGGLDAVVTEATGTVNGVTNNYFGDALAAPGSTTAWASVVGGYGAMPGSSAVNSSLQANWRGRYIDPTGFYYMGARYYEPNSGRFLSADPMGHAGSLDLYSYANGDPVNGLDPDGRMGVGANVESDGGSLEDNPNYQMEQASMGNSLFTPSQGEIESEEHDYLTGASSEAGLADRQAYVDQLSSLTPAQVQQQQYGNMLQVVQAPLMLGGEGEALKIGESVAEEASGTAVGEGLPAGYAGGPGAMWKGENLASNPYAAEGTSGGLVPSLQGNIPNAVKWINNGGSVSYNSEGMLYTLQDGTAVQYNNLGFPNFSPYLYTGNGGLNQVRIALTGSRALDEAAANAAAGFKETPIGYTWHHNEDVGLMQLIEEDVHSSFPHTGGFSLNSQ